MKSLAESTDAGAPQGLAKLTFGRAYTNAASGDSASPKA